MPVTSCMVLQEVEGGSWPMASPPEKQALEPPPRRTGAQAVVRNWAVEASMRALAARLWFSYWAVFTPLTVSREPVPWRQDTVGKVLLTVKVKLVVFVTLPPAPVTVMVKAPVGVEARVERVRVVEQVGAHAVGENAAVAPVGSPVAENDTACAVPATSVALVVVATAAPWVTALLPPLVSAKSKEEEADGL